MTRSVIGSALFAALMACVPARPLGAGPATGGAPSPPGDRLYVANQGDATITVIDIASLEVVDTVDLQELGFSENAKPHHIVVEPDGSFWYVSLIGENRILKLDREGRLVAQAELEVPGMLALHPDGERLYVGRSMSAVNPPHSIGVLRRSDMSVDEIDVFFPRPHALVVHPDGGRVYSASLAVNQLGAIDADTWDMELTTLDGPTHTLVQFAVAPDGRTLVVTGELTGQLLVFDLTDPDHPALESRIDVGERPWHPVFGPDGRFVYVGTKGSDSIVAVDVRAGTIAWTIEGDGLDQPHGSALSPDGRWLFVSNNGPGGMGMAMGSDPVEHHDAREPSAEGRDHDGGTVVVVDRLAGEIVKVIPVGRNTTGIAAPAGR
jgi:YVTN family beta-propeller protein